MEISNIGVQLPKTDFMKRGLTFVSVVMLTLLLIILQSSTSTTKSQEFDDPYYGQKCYWDQTYTNCHWNNLNTGSNLCGQVDINNGVYICREY